MLLRRHLPKNQSGMASLLVTMVLITLLSTIAIAFAVLMSRELNKSVDNQLGQAAYDAAQSGINDAVSYLRDNPNVNNTQCQGLISGSGPLSGAASLSSTTKYTCLLINTKPNDLAYQAVPSDQSKVIKVSTSSPMSKLMISWQASTGSTSKYISFNQLGSLFDESAWGTAGYPPLLQVSLYPVPAGTKDLTNTAANSKTFFLYPTTSCSGAGSTVCQVAYSTTTGTIVPVDCGVKVTNGTFNGSADYDCNVILTGLDTTAPGFLYYVRLTPFYGAADVKIKGDDGTQQSNPVQFINTQAIVDVTAQATGAVKRLQARVDISGLNGTSQDISPSDNGFPEFALRSADTVCKRLVVPSDTSFPAYIDDGSIQYCGDDVSSLPRLTPPVVHATQATPNDYQSATLNGTVNRNNGTVDNCYFQVATDVGSLGSAGQNTCNSFLGAINASTGDVAVNASVSGLNGGTQYYFQICAHNQAGTNCDHGDGNSTGTFTTPAPPCAPCDSSCGNDCGPSNFLTSFTFNNCAPSHNCYNFTGINLGAQCSLYTDNPGGTVTFNPASADGGSVTAGNGPYHVSANTTLNCGNNTLCVDTCVGIPPAPGPQTAAQVYYYDFSGQCTKYNGDGTCADQGLSSNHKFANCHDGNHNYILCVYFHSTPGATCTVSTSTGYSNSFPAETPDGYNQVNTIYNPNDPNATRDGDSWQTAGIILGFANDPRPQTPTVSIQCSGNGADNTKITRTCGAFGNTNYVTNGNQCKTPDNSSPPWPDPYQSTVNQ